jgi:hypothetical protein
MTVLLGKKSLFRSLRKFGQRIDRVQYSSDGGKLCKAYALATFDRRNVVGPWVTDAKQAYFEFKARHVEASCARPVEISGWTRLRQPAMLPSYVKATFRMHETVQAALVFSSRRLVLDTPVDERQRDRGKRASVGTLTCEQTPKEFAENEQTHGSWLILYARLPQCCNSMQEIARVEHSEPHTCVDHPLHRSSDHRTWVGLRSCGIFFFSRLIFQGECSRLWSRWRWGDG